MVFMLAWKGMTLRLAQTREKKPTGDFRMGSGSWECEARNDPWMFDLLCKRRRAEWK